MFKRKDESPNQEVSKMESGIVLSTTDKQMEKESLSDYETILDEVLQYYIHVEKKSLIMVERGDKKKDVFLKEVELYLKQIKTPVDSIPFIIKNFEKFIWGYHVLEDVINDKDISDIKVLSESNIRIKKFGKRLTSNVRFRNANDYKRFVDLVAVKNKTNLSDINAVQNFTDKTSNPYFILRFNISTEYVNSVDTPYLHIRKIPKDKYSVDKLIGLHMMNRKQADYLIDKAEHGRGMLFAGKGASGKTTLMNALLEHIPHDQSGLIIQENEELFTNHHPDLMFQHVITSKGEGKIRYSLKDLARNGLLTDLDYFIIGEIKGGEALYLLNASYTGHKCWASGHGRSSTEALNKIADYVKYESDYSKVDCLKMLQSLETIVFMENFTVKEISEVAGFDHTTGDIIYTQID